MGLLDFISTWFNTKSATEKNIQQDGTIVLDNQVQVIKKWIEKELPPLAWDRIVLRLAKFFIANYARTLNDFEPNSALPDEAKAKIEASVFELYQKKIQIASK